MDRLPLSEVGTLQGIELLLSIAVIQFLAAASPGPTFIVVSGYSVNQSRGYGALAALGVSLATIAWVALAVCGLGTVLGSFPETHLILRFVGAAYLIWVGAKMLLAALRVNPHVTVHSPLKAASPWQPARAGFLTNMTNPKSIAYYSSLFAAMMPHNPPGWFLVAAAGTAVFVSAAWWFTVALFFSMDQFRHAYTRVQRRLNAVFGGLLIILGFRLAFSR
jgi:threonine efflux protein